MAYIETVTEIWLVRHGETAWNAEGRWQGQTDVPLSERGRSEAALAGRRLASVRFDRVVTSDLVRAADTARGIAPGAEIEIDPALREMNVGAWCGLFHAEVAERYPDELRGLWQSDDVRIGGHGETVSELGARVVAAIDRIARQSEGKKVLVVTHGGVIRGILLDMLGLTGKTRPFHGSRNTAITRVVIDAGRRTLRSYNDARHLEHAPLEGEDVLRGAGARDVIATLLGVADASLLHVPSEHAESRVVTAKKQLVAFGVEP